MAEEFIVQETYKDRVRNTLYKALLLEMKDPETGVAVLRSGEIIAAMREIQAMFLAGSPLATPTKMREFADDYGKRLRRETAQFKAHYDEHGSPFPTYVVEGEMH